MQMDPDVIDKKCRQMMVLESKLDQIICQLKVIIKILTEEKDNVKR